MFGKEKIFLSLQSQSPDGGIGRRVGLKHQWSKIRTGSIPVWGTHRTLRKLMLTESFLFLGKRVRKELLLENAL